MPVSVREPDVPVTEIVYVPAVVPGVPPPPPPPRPPFPPPPPQAELPSASTTGNARTPTSVCQVLRFAGRPNSSRDASAVPPKRLSPGAVSTRKPAFRGIGAVIRSKHRCLSWQPRHGAHIDLHFGLVTRPKRRHAGLGLDSWLVLIGYLVGIAGFFFVHNQSLVAFVRALARPRSGPSLEASGPRWSACRPAADFSSCVCHEDPFAMINADREMGTTSSLFFGITVLGFRRKR